MSNKKELKEKLYQQYLKRKEYNKRFQKERYVKVSVNVKRQDLEKVSNYYLSRNIELKKSVESNEKKRKEYIDTIENYLAYLRLKDKLKKSGLDLSATYDDLMNKINEK